MRKKFVNGSIQWLTKKNRIKIPAEKFHGGLFFLNSSKKIMRKKFVNGSIHRLTKKKSNKNPREKIHGGLFFLNSSKKIQAEKIPLTVRFIG
jgi:hypothetical protein